MISTFDLTLLGSLVSAGGLVFLRQREWPHLRLHRFRIQKQLVDLTAETRDHLERSTTLAGARWLTVGALTLFIAYLHGSEEGYLFGPWADVLFHLVFVSSCWATTAFRIHQAAERATIVLTTPVSPR